MEAPLRYPVTDEIEYDRVKRGLNTGWLAMMAVCSTVAIGGHCEDARAEKIGLPQPVAPLTHPVEIGVQDEAALVSGGNETLAKIALNSGKQLSAGWWRIIVSPVDVRRNDWEKYDQAVDRARRHGFHVQLTLAASRTIRSNKKVTQYTGSVARHFKNRVNRYTLYNEPNEIGLEPQTYRRMYQVGYITIKKYNPAAEIEFGSLSSKNYPLVYMHRVLACPKLRPDCPPIKTFRVAYHPYRFTRSPVYRGRLPSWRSEQVGIDLLPLLEQRLKAETESGRLVSTETNPGPEPESRVPRIDLEEFAYSTYSRGKMVSYNISNQKRSKYFIQVLKKVCTDPHVAKLSFYQLVRSPARHLWPGLWDTSMISQAGKPDSPFKRIRSWLRRHPECVATD